MHTDIFSDTPLVTVLIDTYNYAHFISRAIDSVLSQTYPSSRMEILVVDDGSTDNTPEVVSRYGDRLRYIWKPNGGQASAINEGIRQARGEIICLLDADDYFFPDKVQLVVDLFRAHPEVGLVYNKLHVLDADGTTIHENWPNYTWPGDLADRTLLGYSWGCPTSAMSVRKAVVEEHAIPEKEFRICPDYFLTSILPLVTQIGVVESPQCVWFSHGANQGLNNPIFVREYGSLIRVQHGAIRRYAEENLGKRFVTYLGKSGYGTGAEVSGREMVRVYLRESRQLATAQVDPAIKVSAQLKLAVSLLPPSLYDRLRAWKDAAVSLYIRKVMGRQSDHDVKFEAQVNIAALVLHPIKRLRLIRQRARRDRWAEPW